MTARKPRPLTLDERVAVLESEVTALTAQQTRLADLLTAHMEREEETTRAVLSGIAGIEKRIGTWRGIAIGAGLAVSAVWSFLLGVAAWMK